MAPVENDLANEDLAKKMGELGRVLGAREAGHLDALATARDLARQLHDKVATALAHFHAAAGTAGASHFQVALGDPHLDDKHVRAFEFDLRRGRHRVIVTVKSRGEVTLVGPFHQGKAEGPCRSFPFDAEAEIESALGALLETFLEQAFTP
ncbi:MAG: hypothetical protein JRG96_03010 [Deltaproteobacteria bacterium]|nr:hypothetical protein [Deltaproteobacteria bacterium]MBW2417107.1 hypothetical protein [Deltaproteobacteria bacterium]